MHRAAGSSSPICVWAIRKKSIWIRNWRVTAGNNIESRRSLCARPQKVPASAFSHIGKLRLTSDHARSPDCLHAAPLEQTLRGWRNLDPLIGTARPLPVKRFRMDQMRQELSSFQYPRPGPREVGTGIRGKYLPVADCGDVSPTGKVPQLCGKLHHLF